MLIFIGISWNLFKFYSEHQARSDAQTHLFQIKQAYQTHTTMLANELEQLTHNSDINAIFSTPAPQDRLQASLVSLSIRYHLSALDIISSDHQILTRIEGTNPTSNTLSLDTARLLNQALQGQAASLLQRITLPDTNQLAVDNQWVISVAVPIFNTAGTPLGTLVGSQLVDSYFAQTLTQQTSTPIVLCLSGHVQGTAGVAIDTLVANQTISEQDLCTPGLSNIVHTSQSYFTQADQASTKEQLANSPSLVIAAIEPLYSLTSHSGQLLLIITGLGLVIFALGILIYATITRILLVQPLRHLQARVQAMVANGTGSQIQQDDTDEIDMLSNAFELLSESLDNESQVLTEQMSHLLIMSDALISTLHLEHLLGEIVSRLGRIMQAKHVSLLLYGREMPSPWAVAQWSDQQVVNSYTFPSAHQSASHTARPKDATPQNKGAVTVHADPDGDITMAITTKMAAISGSRANSSTTKSQAAGHTKKTAATEAYGSKTKHSRIPRLVLRDLDMSLARIVIQRQKIAYGEDIAMVYQERKERWARLALDAGYRSTIAVPLLFQDQAIGAFILYGDKPRHFSTRDTFLLSTASIQTSMAIQNALLFAEVNEKNVALERANQLKSQFLANVTHELRTPLHSIISYGALILEGFLDGELTTEQEEHIQFMVRRAEDLSHLVDDMLDLSKIEADRIEVKPEPLELAACLTEVVSQLKPLANNKELYLHLETAAGLPQAIADGQRVRQVAINLVSNALKFTEKGGVTIRCALTSDEDMLRVSVSDTGIGISPAALSYIFEAFRQADGSTTRRFGGTGLGLTIAKKLIELQGGEFAVESVPGEGSTFSFTLPIVSTFNVNQ
ncbi:MAG TPA: ATP-binding protein [Ktedonobacteraceae bacterium]|nr:ATP-binding protein [Ktedonobacteraceae bacterium]